MENPYNFECVLLVPLTQGGYVVGPFRSESDAKLWSASHRIGHHVIAVLHSPAAGGTPDKAHTCGTVVKGELPE